MNGWEGVGGAISDAWPLQQNEIFRFVGRLCVLHVAARIGSTPACIGSYHVLPEWWREFSCAPEYLGWEVGEEALILSN